MSAEDARENPPRVFVTYSHDTPEHKEQVRKFCTFLRHDEGLDIHVDQWDDDGRRDWSLWALEQIHAADFILAIASPDFKRRTEGLAPAGEGRGSQFEGAILRDRLTYDQLKEISRILPVVLPGQTIEDIPSFLQPYAATHYVITEFTHAGVSELLAAIVRVAKYPRPERGVFTGNPYAELHAELAAYEHTRPGSSPPAGPADSGVTNHGFMFNGPVEHHGDMVTGGKIVNGGAGS